MSCNEKEPSDACVGKEVEPLTNRRARRGDSLVFTFQIVKNLATGQLMTVIESGTIPPNFPPNSVPQDVTGFTVWFTLKRTTVDPDSQAVAQLDNVNIGGVTISNYAQGQGTVVVGPQATTNFPDGRVHLVYDIQVKDLGGNITTVESGTYCIGPDVTRAITPVVPTPAPQPDFSTQLDWYVDWNRGVDTNPGTQAAPIKTITGGFLSKFEDSDAPYLPNGTTLHIVSAQPKGGEFISLFPRIGFGSLNIVGTPAVSGQPFALGVVTPRSRLAGGNPQWTAAGFTGKTVGQYVVNATRGNSTSIIVAINGDIATLRQPQTPLDYATAPIYSPAGFTVPARVDTWAQGDTVQVYDLPLLNLVDFSCRGSRNDNSGITKGRLWLDKLHIPDQNSTPGYGIFAPEYIGGYVVINECWVDAGIQTQNTTFQSLIHGSYLANGYQFQFTNFAGTVIDGFGAQFEHVNWCEGDTVIAGGSAVTGLLYCEDLCITSFVIMHPGSQMEIRQLDYSDPTGGVIYGSGSLSLQPMSTVARRLPTTSWATCLTVATLKFPGNATIGSAYSATAFTDNIALTPANLDTHHGLMDVRTGARFCEDL